MDDNGLRFSESNYYDSVENEEVQSEEEDLEDEPEETLVSNSVDTQNCLHYKGKRYEDLRYEDLKEVDFESVEEVDTFYSFYSLAMGFSFRKEKLDKNIYGIVVRRQLVCSKEGTRKKNGPPKDNPVSHNLGSRTSFMKSVGIPEKGKQRNSQDMQAEEEGGNPNKRKCPHSHRETRGDCLARLTVKRCNKTGKFRAAEFITEHNHALTPTEMKSFVWRLALCLEASWCLF